MNRFARGVLVIAGILSFPMSFALTQDFPLTQFIQSCVEF